MRIEKMSYEDDSVDGLHLLDSTSEQVRYWQTNFISIAELSTGWPPLFEHYRQTLIEVRTLTDELCLNY